jgi:hypothetical protein
MRCVDAPGHGTTWSGPRAAQVHRSCLSRSRQYELAQLVPLAIDPRQVDALGVSMPEARWLIDLETHRAVFT